MRCVSGAVRRRVARIAVAAVLAAPVAGLQAPARAGIDPESNPVRVMTLRETADPAGYGLNQLASAGATGEQVSVTVTSLYTGYETIPALSFGGSTANWAGSVQLPGRLGVGRYKTSPYGEAGTVLLRQSTTRCVAQPPTLVVHEARYASSGQPTVFSADYFGTCYNTGASYFGEIRWNSTWTYGQLRDTEAAFRIWPDVQVTGSADITMRMSMIGTAVGAVLGKATLREPADAPHPAFSIVSDGCAGRTVSKRLICTVLVRVAPKAVSNPSEPIRAWLNIPDGTPTGAGAGLSATARALPGQTRSLWVAHHTRRLVVHWDPPILMPGGATSRHIAEYRIYRIETDGTRTLAGVSPGSTVPDGFSLNALPDGHTGTYTVRAVLNGNELPEALPVRVGTASRELLYQAGRNMGKPLGPAGPARPISGYGVGTGGISVAHDGSWYAYGSADSYSGLSTVQARRVDGSGQIVEFSPEGGSWDIDPAVSGDGALVAFAHAGSKDEVPMLRVGDTATGTVADVPASAGLSDPAFEPGGQTLVAVEPDAGSTRLVRAHIGTGQRTVLPGTAGGVQPAVAPGGNLVFVRRPDPASAATELRILPAGGGTASTVPGVDTSRANALPAWSPDGGLLVYGSGEVATNGVAQPADIYQVRIATGAVTALTATESVGEANPVLLGDTVDPTAAMSTPASGPAATGTPAVALTPTVVGAWTGSDTGSGVESFDVRYRTAAWNAAVKPYTYPASWQGRTGTSVSLNASLGLRYCFSVRARDNGANLSPWTSDRCATVPLDDRSLTVSGGTRGSSASYYRATYTKLSRAGATLTRGGVTGSRIALVGTDCRTCGAVKVYLAGRYLGTVNFRAATGKSRQVKYLPADSPRSGTVSLVATSAAPVYLDGLAVFP